jgi:hypothetical protein
LIARCSRLHKYLLYKSLDVVGTVLKSKRKITERNKIDSPNTFTWPLTFLSWYRNFNKKWRGKTRLDRKVSGHVLFCMSLRGEIWVLSLVLPRHIFPLLQTYKIIHDRSLSYLGTETSMKSDEVKLALELISPSYRHTK